MEANTSSPIIKQSIKPRNKAKETPIRSVFSRSLITKNIMLPVISVGKNLKQTIERTISSMVEQKCIVEGYVKSDSVKVITFSSGLVKGDNVLFDVVFECEVCFPIAGMLLNCVAKNITKAGIRAESSEYNPSPFVLFIARDHYFANDYFNSIEENQSFVARIIAQRFELNDKYVSIIAELVSPKKELNKPRLVLS
jgi:DNA-directed RNA polymerase subunit E'/Rpb7